MKRFILIIAFLLIAGRGICQRLSIDEFNKERIKITRRSMICLGAWGGANLLYSAIATGSATGSNKCFHQMNLIWSGVNLSFGTIGFLFVNRTEKLDFLNSLKKQTAIEKVYLFNTGLDVAYIIAGFYLRERANSNFTKYDRYRGYGKSFIFQGSALFLFDSIMYLVHQKHGKDLYKLSDNIK